MCYVVGVALREGLGFFCFFAPLFFLCFSPLFQDGELLAVDAVGRGEALRNQIPDTQRGGRWDINKT